jgi:hypothetical protein
MLGERIPGGNRRHRSESQASGEATSQGSQWPDTEGVSNDTTREQACQKDPEAPVGHLDQAVIVLEQAATTAQYEVAAGTGNAQLYEAERAAANLRHLDAQPGAWRGHHCDSGSRSDAAELVNHGLQDCPVTEIGIRIARKNDDAKRTLPFQPRPDSVGRASDGILVRRLRAQGHHDVWPA